MFNHAEPVLKGDVHALYNDSFGPVLHCSAWLTVAPTAPARMRIIRMLLVAYVRRALMLEQHFKGSISFVYRGYHRSSAEH